MSNAPQSLSAHRVLRAVLALSALACAAHAQAQVTFYEGEAYHGRAFTVNGTVEDFGRVGFNDLASSVVVNGGRWEACEDANFRGRCVILREGSYDNLGDMRLSHRLSSVRPIALGSIDDAAPPSRPAPDYSYYRRPDEAVFEVPVTTVHAVLGAPEQRCWVERQEVSVERERSPGHALAGAVIGGVIGHQIGGGSGRDLATVGGVMAGAAIGANSGRRGTEVVQQDVQRCQTVAASAVPAYWDVTYDFRGVTHRVQMSAAPGAYVTVNRDGEPRQ